jgi:two-component system LytT family response regulator
MLKAIIIEDEPHAADLLQNMLLDIEPALTILDKCRDLPSGVKSIKRHLPDIVFLDIELPVYSGLQLLDFFNPEELQFHLIFTTASNDYAVRAFEMSAIDYLMKPLREEKLRLALEKVLRSQPAPKPDRFPVLKQNMEPNGNKRIVVPVANGFEILPVKDICHLKAEGSYVNIFLVAGGSLLVSKNLKYFEFVLAGNRNFVRIHRSFIVNLHFVKKLIRRDGAFLVLESKLELPVTEDKIDTILDLLQNS